MKAAPTKCSRAGATGRPSERNPVSALWLACNARAGGQHPVCLAVIGEWDSECVVIEAHGRGRSQCIIVGWPVGTGALRDARPRSDNGPKQASHAARKELNKTRMAPNPGRPIRIQSRSYQHAPNHGQYWNRHQACAFATKEPILSLQ